VEAVDLVSRAIAEWVPGCPPIEEPVRPPPPDDAIVALGRAIDQHCPAFATQSADATLRALTLAAWASARGGPEWFARTPAGGLALATWAALDVVLSWGRFDVVRDAGPHLEVQSARLAALGTPLRPEAWPAMAALLQERVQAASAHAEPLKSAIAAVLWGRDGRLAVPPDQLRFYGRLGERIAGS
jgi:hypothetical protein